MDENGKESNSLLHQQLTEGVDTKELDIQASQILQDDLGFSKQEADEMCGVKSTRPMGNPYNGYTWKEREEILHELKRLRQKGDLEQLAYLLSKGPCEICGDPGDPDPPTQWHSEDYSPPYRFSPPATFIICATCHLRLHKRFPNSSGKPTDWLLFQAHLRSGGYGREFTKLYSKKRRDAWQTQIEAGDSVTLPSQRQRQLSGAEWWQTLTLDRESLIAAWARPRPWLPRPPQRAYKAALDQIQPTESELALLRFHARFPRRSATMRQLAKGALSSKASSQANLMYGKLAHRLADAMNWEPERREDGSPIWMTSIAEGWQPVDREFEWVMVPTLAALFY